jgi:hypothetical protein
MACNATRIELSNSAVTTLTVTLTSDPGDGTTVLLIVDGLGITTSGTTSSGSATLTPIGAVTADTNSIWDAIIQVGTNRPAVAEVLITETNTAQNLGITITDSQVTYCAALGGGSVVASTLDLTDTPSSYGTAGEVLALNSGATAFEFIANVASGSAAYTGGTVAEGSITDVIALTDTQYTNLTGGPDPNTLYVITDGTTSIDDLDDVSISGGVSNDAFLMYQGTNWHDRTPAQARTALGISSFGASLIDDTDASAARTTLGLANVKTDSYVGHIEAPTDTTYYIDAATVINKTVTELYLKWTNDGSNAGTLVLAVAGSTVDTVDLSSASNPYTSSALSTLATSGDEIKITLTSVADVSDLRFVVEYTQ